MRIAVTAVQGGEFPTLEGLTAWGVAGGGFYGAQAVRGCTLLRKPFPPRTACQGWGLVAMVLLAKGAVGSQAECVPPAEQRDQQSRGRSVLWGRGARLLPRHCLLRAGGQDAPEGHIPLGKQTCETCCLTCLLPGLGEGQGKPQRNVGARAHGESQAPHPTAMVGS